MFVSLFWRLTHNRWAAVILSAFLFDAYHLSPLDTFYRQFWERPVTTFMTTVVMGVVMGYVYLKRGYETAVLGHTLRTGFLSFSQARPDRRLTNSSCSE